MRVTWLILALSFLTFAPTWNFSEGPFTFYDLATYLERSYFKVLHLTTIIALLSVTLQQEILWRVVKRLRRKQHNCFVWQMSGKKRAHGANGVRCYGESSLISFPLCIVLVYFSVKQSTMNKTGLAHFSCGARLVHCTQVFFSKPDMHWSGTFCNCNFWKGLKLQTCDDCRFVSFLFEWLSIPLFSNLWILRIWSFVLVWTLWNVKR